MYNYDNAFSLTIDRAKGVAILLVLLGHIASPFGAFIFSFHVPLFFFLAGIFIKTDYSVPVFVNKNINRLMIPFLIFSSLGLIATIIKSIFLKREIESFSESIVGILYWMDASHMHHYGLVLWFLPALFWGRLIIFLTVKYSRLSPELLLLPALSMAWLASHYLIIPFGIDKGLLALPWILMGYIFYHYHEKCLSAGWKLIAGAFLMLVILVYLGDIQPLDMANKVMGNILITAPYALIISLLFISILYQLGKYIGVSFRQNTDILTELGRNSMLVLVLHIYSNNAFDLVVGHLVGPEYWFVTFFLSASFVYAAIKLKNRYANLYIFRYL